MLIIYRIVLVVLRVRFNFFVETLRSEDSDFISALYPFILQLSQSLWIHDWGSNIFTSVMISCTLFVIATVVSVSISNIAMALIRLLDIQIEVALASPVKIIIAINTGGAAVFIISRSISTVMASS